MSKRYCIVPMASIGSMDFCGLGNAPGKVIGYASTVLKSNDDESFIASFVGNKPLCLYGIAEISHSALLAKFDDTNDPFYQSPPEYAL